MTAGRFVGRVGGLAVALGIGIAAYGGVAVSGADTGAAGADDGRGGARDSGAAHRDNGRGPTRAGVVGSRAARGPDAAAAVTVNARNKSHTRSSARDIPEPAATAPALVSAATVAPQVVSSAVPVAAAAAPELPATESPVSWELLAAARRQPVAAALGAKSVTVNPTVAWGGLLGPDGAKTEMPGVLVGSVNATSPSGLPISYVGIGKPSAGGKIGGGPLLPLSNFYGSEGGFTYLPDAATLTTPGATEKFRIMALENSRLVQAIETALGPLGKLLVPQVLAIIHRIPIVGDLLSPIIGRATIADFTVTPNGLAADRPTAFTYKMPSFDGTLISVNYFPAVDVATGAVDNAPTVLAASGLACAANTDPLTRYGQLFPAAQFGSLTPGIAPLREDAFRSLLLGGPQYDGGGGYNVITWDPRGEFASGGQLQIDNPFFEGRDVSSIISWLTSAANPALAQVKTEAGDPMVGMTGGSYGGGIQLTTVDPRIDAITPEIGWNSLLSSLYPNDAFKTGWGSILGLALLFTGARVNPAIYQGILTGALFGRLSPSSQAVLASGGPTVLLNKEQAPTLLFQGIHDTLFPLAQSVANGQTIQTSPADPPLKLFWFCGGHGDCDIANKPAEQDAQGVIQNLQWLDQYVAKSGTPADDIPTFQWFDQDGLYFNSDYLPWDPNFNQDTYAATGAGGFLPLWPAFGGSGPYPIADLPFSIVNAGKAWNAVNVAVTPPAGNQVVGAPTISFTYSGLGTGHTVYAQLVDDTTGLVLSNIVTPIPVKLDGRTHTVTMSMEDIAYTADTGDSLTLQITSSAINYANAWSYGGIRISDIGLELPLHTTVSPPPWTP